MLPPRMYVGRAALIALPAPEPRPVGLAPQVRMLYRRVRSRAVHRSPGVATKGWRRCLPHGGS